MIIEHYKNPLKLNLAEEKEKNKDRYKNRQPFEHQIKAHSKMSEFFSSSGKRGILVLPTGSGKTYTAVYWLLKNAISKNIKVLWIADQGFLLEQAFETFRENILEVSNIKRNEIQMRIVSGSDRHANGNSISVNDDILLITAQTAISYWDSKSQDDNGGVIKTHFHEFLEEANKNESLYIVYDEAHHTPAFGRRNLLIGGSEGKVGILEKYPKFNLLGLTATPTYTETGKRGWLWKIFADNIIHEAKKKELEDTGILAIPEYQPQKTEFNFEISDSDLEKLMIRHQELPEKIIEKLAEKEERNDFIAKFYVKNREKFGKTIIFVDRWFQCRTIENKINKEANEKIAASVFSYIDKSKNIDYINSRTANQNDINLDKFRKGELQVLVNVKMLTEGVDVPDVKTVFITRETNSRILSTQMIGRALRGKKTGGNKDTANIIFFIDNWNRHVHFAGSTLVGDTQDGKIRERGYRPVELISIDLIDQLNIEIEKQNYDLSYIDLVPVGWYSVTYSDVFIEEIDGKEETSMETFKENVLIYEEEKSSFNSFVENFLEKHISPLWEKEELNKEQANELAQKFILDYFNDIENKKLNSMTMRLIQIARHIGQNRITPEYFSFEQREELNFRKYVVETREGKMSRDDEDKYLDNIYRHNEKTLLRVVFPDYRDFKRAFNYEMEVYENEKSGRLSTSISKPDQGIKTKRLVPDEVRKIVFSRDEYLCACCGKSSNLQVDHIIAAKHLEANDDNPDLYQTLCGTCNREKDAHSYNYRITNFQENKMSVKNVIIASSSENPIYYITRLVNCYYATNAVQKNSVHAENQGNSIWKVKLKYGSSPENNILKHKTELIEIIKSKGYRLKDLEIVEDN